MYKRVYSVHKQCFCVPIGSSTKRKKPFCGKKVGPGFDEKGEAVEVYSNLGALSRRWKVKPWYDGEIRVETLRFGGTPVKT